MNNFFRVFSLTLLLGAFALYAPFSVAAQNRKSSCNTNSCCPVVQSSTTTTTTTNSDPCNFSCDDCNVNGCGENYCNSSCNDNCNNGCYDNGCKISCNDNCNNGCYNNNGCNNNNNCNWNNKSACCGHAGARTLFVPKSLTTDLTLQNALTFFHLYHSAPCPEDRPFFHLQASYFHYQSTNACELAGYFLPGGRTSININEDGTGTVGSLWLGIVGDGGPFSSTVSIAPKRRVDGGYFNFYFDLSRWFCGGWAAVTFAAARVAHTLCFRETNVTNAGGTDSVYPNATAALTQNSALNGARFYTGTRCRSGVDDVLIRFGYDYFFCNYDHVGFYIAGVAPTGRFNHKNVLNHHNAYNNVPKDTNTFLFEPRLGSRHGYIGLGITSDYTIWECDAHGLNWLLELRWLYGLEHCERRTFDLNGRGCNNECRPFSRYLQVVTAANTNNPVSGVASFRRAVNVTPRSTVDFWTALHYDWCQYNFEFGYNLWWRGCEEVCFKCPGDLGVGIYDLGKACANPVSASCATIGQTTAPAGSNVPVSDASFTTVSTSNLNVASGTVPSALTNKVYGGVSYNSEICCMPAMIGFGGSYEFSRDDCNNRGRGPALEQWGVWLRTAISF